MSNESIATLVGLIVANWVTIGPLVYKSVKMAWEKSIEWRDMVHDINGIKKRLDDLESDVNGAHAKIRALQNSKT